MTLPLFDVMPLLEGVVRRMFIISSGTVQAPNPDSPTQGPITGQHYGQKITLLELSKVLPTKVSSNSSRSSSSSSTSTNISISSNRGIQVSKGFIEAIVGYLYGSVDSQFIEFTAEIVCNNNVALTLHLKPIDLYTLGWVAHNTGFPYLLKYNIAGPNTEIVVTYDPDPLLAFQRDLRITMSIPTQKILDPSGFDTNPVSYSLGILLTHIVDVDLFLDSYAQVMERLLGIRRIGAAIGGVGSR